MATTSNADTRKASGHRNLVAACVAHALHDGYTDGLYAFLPVWQSQFGLSYAGLALVRALYSGTMGSLQVPANKLVRSLSSSAALGLATLIAAAGFLIMALPLGFAGLCIGLVVAGAGSSVQHPRGSLLVTETYAPASRSALGIYNFSGDLGKATLPAAAAILLSFVAWRPVVGLMAVLGFFVAFGLFAWIPQKGTSKSVQNKPSLAASTRSGFPLLMTIGAFDTATRMGYLLFLPLLLHARGGTSPDVGLGLALLFLGGALGKAACSWLGERVGVIGSVVMTEIATALLIVFTLYLPLELIFIVLPFLGIALNGTSSVLYGTVPELAPNGDVGRAFALFYTGVLGAGGLAPIAYGAIADHSSQSVGILAAAVTALSIVPMALGLRRFLQIVR